MATDVWRDCFRNWPAEVERRGVRMRIDRFGVSDGQPRLGVEQDLDPPFAGLRRLLGGLIRRSGTRRPALEIPAEQRLHARRVE